MKLSVTQVLLLVIAIFLGVIVLLLFRLGFKATEQDKKVTGQESLPQQQVEEPTLPISRTRTENFSFVAWSESTNTISTQPQQFALFTKDNSDPFLETVTFVENLAKYKNNPETNSAYALISSKSLFGVNNYSIYQNTESKTRLFLLKHKTGKAVLITLSDPTAAVPHYIDLSSVTFSDLTSE